MRRKLNNSFNADRRSALLPVAAHVDEPPTSAAHHCRLDLYTHASVTTQDAAQTYSSIAETCTLCIQTLETLAHLPTSIYADAPTAQQLRPEHYVFMLILTRM